MAKLTKDYNLAALYPNIAKEWHPTKNGKLKPEDCYPKSPKKFWWKCSLGHEWQTSIFHRTVKNNNCRFCIRVKKNDSLNYLDNHPLAKEWHPTKNGNLKPNQFTLGSGKVVWWQCEKGHEWKTRIGNRARKGTGCPKCKPHTSKPELYLLSELESLFDVVHHRLKINSLEVDIFIDDIKLGIEYDGAFFHKDRLFEDKNKKNKLKDFGINMINIREKPLSKIFENDLIIKQNEDFQNITINLLIKILKTQNLKAKHLKIVKNYISNGKQENSEQYKRLISLLPGPLPGYSFKDRCPKFVNEWHPTKNGALKPENTIATSTIKVWWKCGKGHEWEVSPNNRLAGNKCPFCSNRFVGYGNDLNSKFPEVAKEWHPTKNGNLLPSQIVYGSSKTVWWKCGKGHEWQAKVYNRTKRQTKCRVCWKKSLKN